MSDRKRIVIDAPGEAVILAARHLDATEGPVQIGRTVDTAARSAITTVLRYIAKAHNSPATDVTTDSPRRVLTLNCSTCGVTGITVWEDHARACPGPGEIQLTRRLGHGLTVDTAPVRSRIALTVLADAKWGAVMQGADCINIADQVLYRVVGYDAESSALLLDLVEDWRPVPTAKLTKVEAEEIKSRWLEQYGKPGAAHPVQVIEDQP